MQITKRLLRKLIKETITQKEIDGIMGLIDSDEINQAVDLFELLEDDMTEEQTKKIKLQLTLREIDAIDFESKSGPREFIKAAERISELGGIPKIVATHISIPYRDDNPASWRKFGKSYYVYLGFNTESEAKEADKYIRDNTELGSHVRNVKMIQRLRGDTQYSRSKKKIAIDLANLPKWDHDSIYVQLW